MQIYDIAIAPGAPRYIDAEGDYFYFYSGNAGGADSSIKLQGRSSGLQIMLMPGQSYKLPPGTRESSWIITNRVGGGTILGNVIIGMGGIDDNRVTGSVEMIDGGKNRTMANATFMNAFLSPAVAAQNSYAQLWNPAASGKRLILGSLRGTSSMANWSIDVYGSNAQIGAFVYNGTPKLIGSPLGAAQIRNGAVAGIPAGSLQVLMSLGSAGVLTYDDKKLLEPVVINPGFGLVLVGSPVNSTVLGNFEYFEEPI